MAKVKFYGGPYDGNACELPFLPDLLIGETMDGDWGTQGGKWTIDTRVSRYIYQLKFPNGEAEPFEYEYRVSYPGMDQWFDLEPKRP